jgi:hypothetical protein
MPKLQHERSADQRLVKRSAPGEVEVGQVAALRFVHSHDTAVVRLAAGYLIDLAEAAVERSERADRYTGRGAPTTESIAR